MTTLRVKTKSQNKSHIVLSPKNHHIKNNNHAHIQNLTGQFSRLKLRCNNLPFINGWTSWKPPKKRLRHFTYRPVPVYLEKRKKSNNSTVERKKKTFI